MRQSIAPSTAAFPLGKPGGHKLFRIDTGQYAGRQIILYQSAPGQIASVYADRPYTSWSAPLTIAADTADQPFDAAMAPNGDIHAVYTDAATNRLVTRRLGFDNGLWSVYPKVTVTDRTVARFPNIVILPNGSLTVCWSWIDIGTHYLYVKSSADNGATWGSGPSDPGDPLTSGASSVFGKLIVTPAALYAIYSNGSLQLSVRTRALTGGTFGSEYHIATGLYLDEHFDAASAADGRLGVVWNHPGIRYREFDGDQWLPTAVIDTNSNSYPQLVFSDTVPVVVYLSSRGADQMIPLYSSRQSGAFSTPAALDRRAATFDSAVLYDAAGSSYADITAEAADAVAGNVIHPASGALFRHTGDALYLGMDDRFRYVKALLSSAGAGGSVVFSYWDGSSWTAFTPSSGAYSFNSIDYDLLLWPDYNTIPADWQKKLIAGSSRFWIKIEVLSDFTAAPIGSQFTAISDLTALILRR